MTKRRVIAIIIPFIAGIAAVCIIISLTGGRLVGILPGVEYGDKLKTGSIPVNATNSELVSAAYEILGYIKNGDFDKLGSISHPGSGVMFSPYATISPQSSRIFTAAEIKSLARDKKSYVWGIYDGSGEPIDMTATDYFARFVFDRDFTRAKHIGIDTIVRTGNSLENIDETFPDMRFVEFYVPPANTDEVNWSSLRLGFTEYNGSLMLSLILHSEHTI